MRKAALHNLGCKVNSYETEAMQQLLEEAGYQIVPFKEGADVYVINTCSVTNIADRKSRQMLHKAKKMNPNAVVVAAGCYVQAAGEELKKDPAIDLVIGNNKKTELIHMLEEHFAGTEAEGETNYILDIAAASQYETLGIKKISDHTRAFIKVQDGCNQFCSYCIIPYTRGRVRSRRLEAVVSEVERLVEGGYKEVVLTGIHLSSYGLDFAGEEQIDLLGLIVNIHKIKGLERIRLGSLEPRIVTETFAKTLASLKKVCPHFHLSLQSGCEATLKRMNRHYTPSQYLERCQILRAHFENPALTTDVIVGFPGETQEEFDETVEFLQTVGFSEMHVFKYSKRAGTKAAQMDHQVSEEIKTKRSDQLLHINETMSKAYKKLWAGKQSTVLLEETIKIGDGEYLVGHTGEYVKAVVLSEGNRKGAFMEGVLEDGAFLPSETMMFLRQGKNS